MLSLIRSVGNSMFLGLLGLAVFGVVTILWCLLASLLVVLWFVGAVHALCSLPFRSRT
jgi:hypothetical protein